MKYKDKQRNNFKYIVELKNKATEAELIVLNWLLKNNIKHIFQKGFLKPFHRIVDFYIPKKKIIIEIDGGYHNDIKNKDSNKDNCFYSKRGMTTIRITNSQVYNNEFKTILLNYLCI